jgi:pyruvate formate lyase activating enzyme
MAIQCTLCPKTCLIKPGQSGECRIRVNIDNELIAVTYGYPCSIHIDPIEKKPLFHFLPGTGILSIATVGCNLHCKNCQNWEISQENPENIAAHNLEPNRLVELAKKLKCQSVAYTYTDPVVYYEYALDSAIQAQAANLRNVLVTAGYINQEPLKKLYSYTDAANIDLKALSDNFYRTICSATLKPVLEALVLAKSMGVWVEATNLVIPTLNDSDKELRALARWIKQNLGPETPLHFSRFSPQYKLQNLPPTPEKTLKRAHDIAISEGLYYVYVGNLPNTKWQTTKCHKCNEPIINRQGYKILENNLIINKINKKGYCPKCNSEVHGIWI